MPAAKRIISGALTLALALQPLAASAETSFYFRRATRHRRW